MNETCIAIPPGETIKEQLEDLGIDKQEFAGIMGLTKEFTEKLIEGEAEIDLTIASKLEKVLGIPARFWINLETIYRGKVKKILDNQ